jgi:hypothetical protein
MVVTECGTKEEGKGPQTRPGWLAPEKRGVEFFRIGGFPLRIGRHPPAPAFLRPTEF